MSNFAAKVRENIRAEDLPEPLQNLALIFDIESVRKLIERHPCERIYVPKLQSIRGAIKRTIEQELETKKSLNLKAMAYDLNVGIDHLRLIVKEIYEEKRKN